MLRIEVANKNLAIAFFLGITLIIHFILGIVERDQYYFVEYFEFTYYF